MNDVVIIDQYAAQINEAVGILNGYLGLLCESTSNTEKKANIVLKMLNTCIKKIKDGLRALLVFIDKHTFNMIGLKEAENNSLKNECEKIKKDLESTKNELNKVTAESNEIIDKLSKELSKSAESLYAASSKIAKVNKQYSDLAEKYNKDVNTIIKAYEEKKSADKLTAKDKDALISKYKAKLAEAERLLKVIEKYTDIKKGSHTLNAGVKTVNKIIATNNLPTAVTSFPAQLKQCVSKPNPYTLKRLEDADRVIEEFIGNRVDIYHGNVIKIDNIKNQINRLLDSSNEVQADVDNSGLNDPIISKATKDYTTLVAELFLDYKVLTRSLSNIE